MEQSGSVRRELQGPAYPDDTGAVADEVAAALTTYAGSPGDTEAYVAVVAALQAGRLLVPVVAVLGDVEVDEAGLAHDKSSDMAAVLLTGADGRLALLAFTGIEPLAAWDADARPVPVLTQLAAQSAIQEGAAALVVDVAGPVPFVIEGDDVRGLAAGWTLARVDGRPAWVGPTD
jgi:hypothetical protein